jgi:hypothetical protein
LFGKNLVIFRKKGIGSLNWKIITYGVDNIKRELSCGIHPFSIDEILVLLMNY